MKTFRLFVAFTLVCFTLLPNGRGVVPPPSGGYPNFTTAAGDHALQALTLGVGNTAIGTFSLFSVTTGSFNTAVGAGSLDLNLGDFNESYTQKWEYVFQNPVRAGLIARAEDWPYAGEILRIDRT